MQEIFDINNPVFLLALKAFLLTILLIYIGFSIIVEKQVRLMTDTLEIGFEKPIRAISLLHLILAIIIFIFAVVIL